MTHHCDFSRHSQEASRLLAVQIVAGSRHTLRMTREERRENFKAWMARKGLTVYRLSADTGIPTSTLYGYITRGTVQTLKDELAAKIAKTYDTTIDALFGAGGGGVAPVMGKIGARAEVRPFDEAGALYEVDVPPTLEVDEEYVAFEIEGFSMPPAQPGWVVLFRKKPLPFSELVGFPCLVDLSDGRRLFKVLQRGYTPGKWNLVSWDGSAPLEDEDVTAALPFVAMTPGRMRR